MTTLLASFPSPPQGVWHLGWLPIRAYALCIIIGIIVALVVGDRRWAARGGERGVIYDIALWAVPFGLIGGRLYHVITDWKTYFGDDGAGFIAALKIWDGGLGIWGAVALGGVGAWIGCRRRGIPLPAFGDAIAPGIILAQAIGRLGNYFNQELYGRPTTMPWGLEIYERRDPSGLIDVHSLDGVSTGQVHAIVQPTFLYELLWNVLVFVALIYIDRRFRLGHGRLFAMYVAGYCIGRFWVELLRSDMATHIAGIRINSFTSTFVFIGAVVYIVLAPKGREDPASLAGKPREDKERPKKPEPEVKVPKAAVAAEDSELMEWTKELAAVAAPSGVVAGVAVAAQDDEGPAGDAGAEDFAPDVNLEDTDEVEEPEGEAAAEEAVDDSVDEAEAEEPEADTPEAEAEDAGVDEVDEVEAEEAEDVAEADEAAEDSGTDVEAASADDETPAAEGEDVGVDEVEDEESVSDDISDDSVDELEAEDSDDDEAAEVSGVDVDAESAEDEAAETQGEDVDVDEAADEEAEDVAEAEQPEAESVSDDINDDSVDELEAEDSDDDEAAEVSGSDVEPVSAEDEADDAEAEDNVAAEEPEGSVDDDAVENEERETESDDSESEEANTEKSPSVAAADTTEQLIASNPRRRWRLPRFRSRTRW